MWTTLRFYRADAPALQSRSPRVRLDCPVCAATGRGSLALAMTLATPPTMTTSAFGDSLP